MKVLIGIVSSVVLMATCHATPLGSKRVCHVRPTYEFEYELSQAIKRKISGPPTFEELDTDTEDGKVVIDEFTEFNGKISKEFQASYSELKGKVDDHKAEVEKVVFKLFQQADVDDDKSYLGVEEFETFVGYFSKVEEIQDVGFGDIVKADDCMVSFAEIKPKFVDEPVEQHLAEINSITAKAEEDKAVTEDDLYEVFSNLNINCDESLDKDEYALYKGPTTTELEPPECKLIFDKDDKVTTENVKTALAAKLEVVKKENEELKEIQVDEFSAIEQGVQLRFDAANTEDDDDKLNAEEFKVFQASVTDEQVDLDFVDGNVDGNKDGKIDWEEAKIQFVDKVVQDAIDFVKFDEEKLLEELAGFDEKYGGVEKIDGKEAEKLTTGIFFVDGKASKDNTKKELVAKHEEKKVTKIKSEVLQSAFEKKVRREFDEANTEDNDNKLNEEEFKKFQAGTAEENIIDVTSIDGNIDGNIDGKIDWGEAKKQFVDEVAAKLLLFEE